MLDLEYLCVASDDDGEGQEICGQKSFPGGGERKDMAHGRSTGFLGAVTI